ncbi:TolC family protein [candidate division KSB1 bacterium]|nr:TolC family protein [candidate division KSB1 bacterium]
MRMKNRLTQMLLLLLGGLSLIPTASSAQERLTLKRAFEIALAQSPDLQQAWYQLVRSRELLKAEQAALKSHFSLSLTPYDYTKDRRFNSLVSLWNTEEITQSSGLFAIKQPIRWTDGTLQLINRFSWQDAFSEFHQSAPNRSFNNNLYLSWQQPIFTYNRTQFVLRELELSLENATLNYAIQKLAIEKLVHQSFYDFFYKKQSLSITLDEAKNNEESYQIIKKKVEAGIAAQEELYQADLNLANSRSAVENAQVQFANAIDDFKNLLGLSLFREVTVDADIQHHEIPVDLEKATAKGLRYRMELRQDQIQLQSALAELTQTSALNEFKGNITISYGIIGTNEAFREVYTDPTQNQKFSISLEIPLWDWGEKHARLKAQEAKIQQQKLTLSQTENSIVIGIRRAYRNIINQVAQIEIARVNVKNAQLTYDINLERYKNGDLTSKDLGYYQNQLSREKLGLIQALIQYRLALLDLKIQSLWDFERDQPVLEEGK